MEMQTPFNEFSLTIKDDWIDYNGHLNVGYYLVAFDLAVEPFFNWLGLTPEFRRTSQCSTFALETHLNFLAEVNAGDELRFETRLIDFNQKTFHFYQEMFQVENNYLAASHESLAAYMDMTQRKTTLMPSSLTTRLGQIQTAHSALDTPWQLGHKISVRHS